MCFVISSTHFAWNTSHSKKKRASYGQKCLVVFMKITPYSWTFFNKTWIFSTDLKKNSNNKFHENPTCGSREVPCGQMEGGNKQTDRQTERQDESNNRFLQFCERA